MLVFRTLLSITVLQCRNKAGITATQNKNPISQSTVYRLFRYKNLLTNLN
jgi:hypothetical protein